MARVVGVLIACVASTTWAVGPSIRADEPPPDPTPDARGAEVADYDEAPEVVKRTDPKYPQDAFDGCVEGSVLVSATVDARGHVVDARVVESVPELDEAALDCVKRWRFKPARKAGVAVTGQAEARVVFKAKDSNRPACRLRAANAAQTTAEAWLKLVDAGDYRASWEQASSLVRSQVTAERWAKACADARSVGVFQERWLLSRSDGEGPPDLGARKLVVIKYDADFAGGTATETVAMALGPEGQWGVVGYSVAKGPTRAKELSGDAAASSAEPIRAGGRITEPRKLKHVNPAYPLSVRKAHIQGTVKLDCTIDTRGRVVNVKVLRGHPWLAEAAVEAVKQWLYEPALLDGRPVPVIFTVTVTFRVN